MFWKRNTNFFIGSKIKKEGRKIERLSFPMYDTPTGKIVGGALLGKQYICDGFFPEGAGNVDPKVASLYYAADRKYNIGKINELLDQGVDVILDRYVESNMGCQGGKIFDKEERLRLYQELDDLEYGFLGLPRPDFTIFLYMPSDKVFELKRGMKSFE